jgi:hypothetical protein
MAAPKKKRYLDALTQALGIGGHEASASAASDVSEPPLKTQKVGHHVESAVADPLKSRPLSDISKGLHHVQPVGGVSIGLYESSDGIVAACSVVEEETRFEVTDFRRNASAKGPPWSATLKPLPDRGASKAWMMRGEPQGDVLVESEDGFVQVAASSETKRRVWRYVGLLEGHDRLGREPSDVPVESLSVNVKAALSGKNPNKNELFSPDMDRVVHACCACPSLPVDALKRKKMLAWLYTLESPLYKEMNRALRDDDLSRIRYFSAFIKEFRELFRTCGDGHQVLEPFKGLMWRGIQVTDAGETFREFTEGKRFVWPAFTSMTTNKAVAEHFGNLVFEIRCSPGQGTYESKALYAPASVSKFSDFPSESEVVFPPNTQFEVIGRREGKKTFLGLWDSVPTVVCQTVGLDGGGHLEFLPALSLTIPE